jgi:hypothetical protein
MEQIINRPLRGNKERASSSVVNALFIHMLQKNNSSTPPEWARNSIQVRRKNAIFSSIFMTLNYYIQAQWVSYSHELGRPPPSLRPSLLARLPAESGANCNKT